MASLTLKLRIFAKLLMVLSVLIFIEMTCEVGLVKLDFRELKNEDF